MYKLQYDIKYICNAKIQLWVFKKLYKLQYDIKYICNAKIQLKRYNKRVFKKLYKLQYDIKYICNAKIQLKIGVMRRVYYDVHVQVFEIELNHSYARNFKM